MAGEGRGFSLRRMKRDLYTADGERFREEVFIERSSEIPCDSYFRHTAPYEGYRGFAATRYIHRLLFIYGITETPTARTGGKSDPCH